MSESGLTRNLSELYFNTADAMQKAAMSYCELAGTLSPGVLLPPYLLHVFSGNKAVFYNKKFADYTVKMEQIPDLYPRGVVISRALHAATHNAFKVHPVADYIQNFMDHPMHYLISSGANAARASVPIADFLRPHRHMLGDDVRERKEDLDYPDRVTKIQTPAEARRLRCFYYLDHVATMLKKDMPEETKIQEVIARNKSHMAVVNRHYIELGYAAYNLKP